jgi:hypothetical protein
VWRAGDVPDALDPQPAAVSQRVIELGRPVIDAPQQMASRRPRRRHARGYDPSPGASRGRGTSTPSGWVLPAVVVAPKWCVTELGHGPTQPRRQALELVVHDQHRGRVTVPSEQGRPRNRTPFGDPIRHLADVQPGVAVTPRTRIARISARARRLGGAHGDLVTSTACLIQVGGTPVPASAPSASIRPSHPGLVDRVRW